MTESKHAPTLPEAVDKKSSTRSPPKGAEKKQAAKKKKLKTEAEKTAEKAQHLRFGKAEISPEEASRMTKAQKREMYAAPLARSAAHREVDQYEDDNVGTQALNEGDKAVETVDHLRQSRYARKLKKRAKAQAKSGTRGAQSSEKSAFDVPASSDSVIEQLALPENASPSTEVLSSNPISRWHQKQAIHRQYAEAARTATRTSGTVGAGSSGSAGGQKAASGSVSAAKSGASGIGQMVDTGKTAVGSALRSVVGAVQNDPQLLATIVCILLLILLLMSAFSSCSIFVGGSTQVSGQVFYTAEDKDIKKVEEAYCKMEKQLQKKIDNIESQYPGYDEYRYNLDGIEHDPWELASLLTTLYDKYTLDKIQSGLETVFNKQYRLSVSSTTETRYRTVAVYDPVTGGTYYTRQAYQYKILHVKLINYGLEKTAKQILSEDQYKRYQIFQETQGGRPYLFNGGNSSDGSGDSGLDYQIPAEALTDTQFATMMQEATKYLGTAYVWGGSTPETGFDCSGYVCWVLNQSGWDIGRTTANGLWQQSTKITESEAKPGDLVFFEGTYDTAGASHVGIYVGDGVMISAGDPIKYSNIHSSYWDSHLLGFGRIPK